jgi:hypothetical protein
MSESTIIENDTIKKHEEINYFTTRIFWLGINISKP